MLLIVLIGVLGFLPAAVRGQHTYGCEKGPTVYYTVPVPGVGNQCDCCTKLTEEINYIKQELETLKGVSTKGTQSNPGRSCRDIRQSGVTRSGSYWVQPDPDLHPFPVQVFCEMEFNGGGWTRVFNMMEKPQEDTSAVEMFAIISRTADIRIVLANTTSSAVYTRGLRLQEYTQVVFGWAPSSESVVSHYGLMVKEEGFKGVCYVDGACPDRQNIGEFTSSVSGITRMYQTGYGADIAHVGIGYRAQAIVWGYDRNVITNYATAGTFYSRWGNWNDTLPTSSGSPCCNSGSTEDLLEPEAPWRYSILIR